MPAIEPPRRRVAPGGTIRTRATSEDFGAGVGRAIGAVGASLDSLASVADRAAKTQQAQELARLKTDFARRREEVILELENDSDFDTQHERYQQAIGTILDSYSESAGAQLSSRLREEVQPLIDHGSFAVRRQQIAGQMANATETLKTTAADLARLAASNDPGEREYARETLETSLQEYAEGFGVPDSSIEAFRRGWENTVRQERGKVIETTLTTTRAALAEASRAGDERRIEALADQARGLLEEGVEVGAFTPAQQTEQDRRLVQEIIVERTLGDFERVLQEDGLAEAEGVQDAFERQRTEQLTPEAKDQAVARMEVLLNRERAARNREEARRNGERAALDRLLKQNVEATRKILEEGFQPPEGALDRLITETAGTEYEREVFNMARNAGIVEEFSLLPPTVRDETINTIRAQPRISGEGLETLQYLEAANASLNTAINRDPLGLAMRLGIVDEVPPMSAVQTPEDLAEAIAARREGAGAASARFQRNVPPITAAEASALGNRLEQLPASQRVDMLAAIVAGGGSDAALALGEIDAQNHPTLALVGGLVLEGARGAAETVARGQDIMASDSKIMPPRTDFDPMLRSMVGPAYIENSAQLVAAEDGVRAAYAALSQRDRDLSGQFNRSRLREAVQLVTGGIISHRAGIFGPQSAFPVPARGMTDASFGRWFDSITPDDVAEMGDVAGFSPERALELMQGQGRLIGIGRGRWLISVGTTPEGQPIFLKNRDESEFVLTYPGPTDSMRRAASRSEDTRRTSRAAELRREVRGNFPARGGDGG